jgi:hypothetical protein
MPSWPTSAPASWQEQALRKEEAGLAPLKWRQLYAEAVERLGDAQTARWFVEDSSGGAWPAVLD